MTDLRSIASLAKLTGLARPTVKRALASAGVEAVGGKYPTDAVQAALAQFTDPALVAGHASTGRGEAPADHVSDLAQSRARAERQRAIKLEMQNRKLAGELVERAAILDTGKSICAAARAAFLAVGAKVSARLVGQADAIIIQQIIDDAAREALGVLADPDRFNEAVLS